MTQTQPCFKVLQVHSVEPLHEPTLPSTTVVPTSLTLTFFDLFWLRFTPVEYLFFYELPNLTTTSFFDTILPSLKHSLSLTLQHFLPLSGTLKWPLNSSQPIINYAPGDTVSFTVAESNENFNHLCSQLCEATKRHCLAPHLTTSHDKASLLALQVTVFPNSGFCIGITTHHAAFDGKSINMFTKSWAYICSNLQNPTPTPTPSSLLPQNLTPIFDRSVIKDPSGISERHVEAWEKSNGPNNRSLKVWESLQDIPRDAVRGLFELTPSQILKLKEYAKSKMKTKVLRLSTFSVTYAYVLACVVKAEQPKEDNVSFLFTVDCRPRLDPPIPESYFGNCIVVKGAMTVTEKLAKNDGFISALEGLSEALNIGKEGLLNEIEDQLQGLHKETKGKIFSVAGSPWFKFYSTDFGWGRPKKVDMTSTDKTGAFSLSESRDHSGGIEIGLVLSKRHMEAFSSLFVQELESF